MCLQVFFEGRWRLCRGDVRRQAIPDSRCSHSEDSIADCFQSGTPDDQFVTRERVKLADWLMERRMLRICCRAAKQLDTVRDTWVFMDMSLSRNMPRSRTDFAGLTISPQTENVSLGTKCCWWFEAHPITSVLAAFSCKRFGDGYSFCIHDSMSQHTDTGNPLDTWPTAAPFLPGLFRVSVFTNGWLARPRLIKYQNCVAVLY